MNEDNVKPLSITLHESLTTLIDKYRVGNNQYKNRSDYIQTLILKDLKFDRWEYLSDMMSSIVLPMMGFFVFLAFAFYTQLFFFYLLMVIFGGFSVFFSYMYSRRHHPKKKKKQRERDKQLTWKK